MQIVANERMLRKFKTIKEFRVDLGESFTKTENLSDAGSNPKTIFKINDEFVKQYLSLFNHYIFKYGNIGKLRIYTDHSMKNDMLAFFEGDNMYDVQYDNNPDFREFLNKTITDIQEKEQELIAKKLEQVEIKEETFSTKHMSQDQLIKHLLEQRSKGNG